MLTVLIDPALAFAIGWNIVYGCFLSVPSEISAAVVLIQYWTDINAAVWVTILIVVSVVVAISFIGVYGEVEFIFAILKILLVIFVVILGLVIDLGGVPGQFVHPLLPIERLVLINDLQASHDWDSTTGKIQVHSWNTLPREIWDASSAFGQS